MADETPKAATPAAKPAVNTPPPAEKPVEEKQIGTENVKELSREDEKALEDLLGKDAELQPIPEMEELRKKVLALSAKINADTPNEHILFGLSGTTFNVGDLRLLAKNAGSF